MVQNARKAHVWRPQVCVPLTAACVVTTLMRGIKYWRRSSEEQESEKDNREEKMEEEGYQR